MRPICPRPSINTHSIYNCGIPFLGYHYYILSVSDLSQEKRRNYIKFYTWYPNIKPILGVGS